MGDDDDDNEIAKPDEQTSEVQLTLAKSAALSGCSVVALTDSKKRKMKDASGAGTQMGLSRAGSSKDLGDGASVKTSNSEPPEKKVGEWIQKLDLQSILDGVKKGVQKHHASDCLRKCQDEGQQALLKNHLELVEAAQLLNPSEILSASDGDVHRALATLHGAAVTWPHHLQWNLWRRALFHELTSLRADVQPSSVTKIWEMARPYSVKEGTVAAFDWKAPMLHAVQGKSDEKATAFEQVIYKDVLLNGVVRGECFAHNAEATCSALLALAGKDLLSEVSELYVPILPKIKSTVIALKALLSKDIFEQLEAKAHISKIRDAITSKATDPCSNLAKGMGGCPWWKGLLDKYMTYTLSLEVHQPKIESVRDLFEKEAAVQTGDVNTMLGGLQDLAILTSDLPESCVQPLKQKASEKMWGWWQTSMSAAQAGVSPEPATVHVMDKALSECQICFPLEARWESAKREFAEMNLRHKGRERLQQLVQAGEALTACLASDDEADVEKIASAHIDFSTACKQAQGLALSEDDKTKLLSVAAMLSVQLQKTLAGRPEIARKHCSARDALQRLDKSLVEANLLEEQDQAITFTAALSAWRKSGVDEDARLSAKDAQIRLGEMICAFLQCCNWAKEGCWCWSELEKSLAEAADIVERANKVWCDDAKLAYQRSVQCLEPLAGGAPGGASWTDGLPQNAAWADVMKKAETSIMKLDVGALDAALQKLDEARISAPYNPGGGNANKPKQFPKPSKNHWLYNRGGRWATDLGEVLSLHKGS